MALVNMLGGLALESTQQDTQLEHGEILLQILLELRQMNMHLAAISGEKITAAEIQDYEP